MATRVVWAVVTAIVAAQFAVTYLPPLQMILGASPVRLRDGLLTVATWRTQGMPFMAGSMAEIRQSKATANR